MYGNLILSSPHCKVFANFKSYLKASINAFSTAERKDSPLISLVTNVSRSRDEHINSPVISELCHHVVYNPFCKKRC